MLIHTLIAPDAIETVEGLAAAEANFAIVCDHIDEHGVTAATRTLAQALADRIDEFMVERHG